MRKQKNLGGKRVCLYVQTQNGGGIFITNGNNYLDQVSKTDFYDFVAGTFTNIENTAESNHVLKDVPCPSNNECFRPKAKQ